MIIPDAKDTLPASTVKRRFLELLKQLGPERAVITITRNGVPAGVLMSIEEYESLMETLEILANAKIMRSLARSAATSRAGAHSLTSGSGAPDELPARLRAGSTTAPPQTAA